MVYTRVLTVHISQVLLELAEATTIYSDLESDF